MGCKVLKWLESVIDTTGFTLTMWDVKKLEEMQGYSVIEKFYLNYVGCKAACFLKNSSVEFSFYLNYVGCKVYITSFAYYFCWLFYLNYVGCKVFLLREGWKSISGFYLNYVGCKATWANARICTNRVLP